MLVYTCIGGRKENTFIKNFIKPRPEILSSLLIKLCQCETIMKKDSIAREMNGPEEDVGQLKQGAI